MTSSRRCSCGALRPRVNPSLYRQAAALLAAYMHGEDRLFEELYEASPKPMVWVLVDALHDSLGLIAEYQGRAPLDVLKSFALGAERVAQAEEAR